MTKKVERYSMSGRVVVEVSQPLIEGLAARVHVGLDESHVYRVVQAQAIRLATWFLTIAAAAIILG